MDTYRVGIIGTGFGSKVQAPAMQADPRFHVEMIAGTKAEKTTQTAELLGIEKHSTDWREVLKEDLDLIVVSTPPYLHYTMAKAILKSNTHLLLEKPTTSNAFEAKKLYRMAEDRNLVGLLSHEFRWVPERAYVQDLLQKGAIGSIREVYLSQFMNFGVNTDVKKFGWFWNSLYEGGIIGALGSHLVDYVRFLTGSEFDTIQGGIQTIVTHKIDELGQSHRVSADTGFNFNFEMEGQIFGNMTASSTIHHPPSSRLVVAGEEGTIVVENGISMAKAGEEMQSLEIPERYSLDMSQAEADRRIPPYMKLLDQLAQSLDAGTSLSPNLYDGWKNQQVIDAVKLSQQTGSRVKITD